MLNISRPDIVSTHIIEYDKPFLKVPISKYLDLIDIEPIPSQIAVINAINSPQYRFITAALSRRQGKTFIANVIAQCVSLVPGCNILIMSPNYSLSSISFELQRQLIKKFDIEVAKNNVKDKIIELTNGSTIRMGSVSQADAAVGRSYDLILFDEAALNSDGRDAFNVALRPTLDKPNSKCIFISTPRGKFNWFSEFYDRGFSDEFPNWISIHATWHENPRVSVEDIEEAKRGMSRAEFEQEYLASFNSYEGRIWNFDSERDIIDSVKLERFDCIVGIDWGFKDATAFVVVLYDWISGDFYIVEDYCKAERTTEEHALALHDICSRWNPDFIYIDSAAAQTRHDLAQMYGISSSGAKKSVLDGIGYLGSLFENGKIKICSNCTEVIKTVDQYQWDNRGTVTKEKPLHNSASHIADALRYAIFSFNCGSVGVY